MKCVVIKRTQKYLNNCTYLFILKFARGRRFVHRSAEKQEKIVCKQQKRDPTHVAPQLYTFENGWIIFEVLQQNIAIASLLIKAVKIHDRYAVKMFKQQVFQKLVLVFLVARKHE